MKKLLLSSVFGPFGVDDDYGRKSNVMELMHNQVTREQGLFSLRFNHASFGLYFLAENVSVSTTVLDFPTLKQFQTELERGYEYVGISSIIPNFKKARKMAQMVREIAPSTKIILGGHATGIPDIEKLIDCDYICRGEGVGFLRGLFGEDTDAPIRHPVLHSSYNRQVLGAPVPDGAAVLVPGVGCANRCRFCATSHFFGKYIPYLESGRAVYDACVAAETELGVTDFGVLDENFLKLPERARELVDCMEQNDKKYTFGIFSSAETLSVLGDLDLLVRMGVNFIWLGIESKREVYEKNRGIDFKHLVSELRRRGVAVMGSAILFLEHHTPETIGEDIDFAIDLRPDYLQFMELGPIPGTELYEDYARQGKLLDHVPYEEQHGQDAIWFSHPSFPREQTPKILADAFKKDYALNGPSFLRNVKTNLMGYRYADAHADPRVRARRGSFRQYAQMIWPLLPASAVFAKNDATAKLVAELRKEHRVLFGPSSLKDRLKSVAVVGFAALESLRRKTVGDTRHPPMATKRYRWEDSPVPDSPSLQIPAPALYPAGR